MNTVGPDIVSGRGSPVHGSDPLTKQGRSLSVEMSQNSTVESGSSQRILPYRFTPEMLENLKMELAQRGFALDEISESLLLKALFLTGGSISQAQDAILLSLRCGQPVMEQLAAIIESVSDLLGELLPSDGLKEWLVSFRQNAGAFIDVSQKGLTPSGIHDMVLSSGIAFEWRLFAWYRTGNDPALLRALLMNDLKGMLLELAERLKRHSVKGSLKKKVNAVRKQTESLVRSLDSRELTALIGDRNGELCLQFELPSGDGSGHGRVVFRARRDKSGDHVETTPRIFSLVIDVDTSCLGAVKVFMSLAAKTIYVHVVFPDGTLLSAARNMLPEIRSALISKGFAVGALDVAIRDSARRMESPPFPMTTGMDVTA